MKRIVMIIFSLSFIFAWNVAIDAKTVKAEEKKVFSVQTASFGMEENALKRMEELKGNGWPRAGIYSIRSDKDRLWYIVHIGIYEARDDAVRAADQYMAENKDETVFLKSFVPELAGKNKIYTVQTASFGLEKNALKRMEELKSNGWPRAGIYSIRGDEDRLWYIVHIGIYEARDDAERAANQYIAENKGETVFLKSFDPELLEKSSITPYTEIASKTPLADAVSKSPPPDVKPAPKTEIPSTPTTETVSPSPTPDEKPASMEAPLSQQETLKVIRINIQGNTSFSQKELSVLCAPYENREVAIEELEELRRIITLYYTDRGYINSGARIPEQDIADGVIDISIIEGKITATKITENRRLNTRYIKSRLESALPNDRAFNIGRLEERLKLLKQDRLIENINALISPGLKPGEAALELAIDEASPYQLSVKGNNYGSPAIGANQGEITIAHYNLTGWGESLELKYRGSEGFDNYSADYTIPLTHRDTTLGFSYSKSAAMVVSYPFKMLNIKSETETAAATLRHPFYKTLSRELAAGVKLKKHRNKTFLLGLPWSFTSHVDDDKTEVTELSFFQEWVSRSMTRVFTLRSDLKLGLNWFNATVHKELDDTGREYADSVYTTWLGQLQWFKQMEFLNSAFLFKTNLQFTNDPQLSSGKFSLGGHATVRGYRENYMTTDNGVLASLEWRIPVFQLKLPFLSKTENDGQVQFCPFYDFGRGWNIGGLNPVPQEICSVGAGLRWSISKKIQSVIYYGYRLRTIPEQDDPDLQDDGIHFEVKVDAF